MLAVYVAENSSLTIENALLHPFSNAKPHWPVQENLPDSWQTVSVSKTGFSKRYYRCVVYYRSLTLLEEGPTICLIRSW